MNESDIKKLFTQFGGKPPVAASPKNDIEDVIEGVRKYLDAAPVIGMLVVGLLREMKGKLPVGDVFEALRDLLATEFKPVGDWFKKNRVDSVKESAKLVKDVMSEFQMSEECALRLVEMQVYQEKQLIGMFKNNKKS